MEQRLSLITLGVGDVAREVFYEPGGIICGSQDAGDRTRVTLRPKCSSAPKGTARV